MENYPPWQSPNAAAAQLSTLQSLVVTLRQREASRTTDTSSDSDVDSPTNNTNADMNRTPVDSTPPEEVPPSEVGMNAGLKKLYAHPHA